MVSSTDSSEDGAQKRSGRTLLSRLRAAWRELAAAALVVAVTGVFLAVRWPVLGPLLRDGEALRAAVAELGWWGPIELVALNVLQIVVAPIPGYALYIGAGYLYGWLAGGIWASVGLLLGGMAAMATGRFLGRPIVTAIIGDETVARWESTIRTDNVWAWAALFLSPIGDAPFLLAGLSQIRFRTILLLALVMRVPQAFVASAAGAGAFELTWWQVVLLTMALAAPLLLWLRYQERVIGWFSRRRA